MNIQDLVEALTTNTNGKILAFNIESLGLDQTTPVEISIGKYKIGIGEAGWLTAFDENGNEVFPNVDASE